MVIYALRPNRLYEAIEVLFDGKRFGIEGFRKLAGRRLKDQAGALRSVPGRYLYFAPTIELWGVILGDHGYAVVDPEKIPPEVTPEVREIREGAVASGIIARIPSYSPEKLAAGSLLPVFSQVELTVEPRPGPQSRWIRFEEYQQDQMTRSQPPAVIIQDFLEWLHRLAAESGFRFWSFRPGMLFGDPVEWWGDGNLRRSPHEGLDFAEGQQPGGGIQAMPEGSPVRAMAEGEVIAVLNDFLGKTVVVRHPSVSRPDGTVFCTLYSHILPEAGSSRAVVKGQLLGKVIKATTATAPAHLHLTGAWIPQALIPDGLTMERINPAFAPISLVKFDSYIQTCSQHGTFLAG
jgi:hypothetical protein